MKIVADNKIPGIAEFLSPEFELCLLPLEEINATTLRDADILIGRSVLKVNQSLLENTAVQAVGTCSSGTDHVDINYLNENNITFFSAQGSNAQGVADYVLWMLAYCAKNQIIHNKNAGIIGVGHVGKKVQSLLEILGFNVLLNDPLREIEDPSFVSSSLEKIAECDVICVHPALTKAPPYPSYHLLSDSWWELVKSKTVLINASRGAVIDTAALLRQKKDIHLCLDVFENEPNINELLVKQCLVATPHIAGHTVESFYRATKMIADQVHAYVNIKFTPVNKQQETCQTISLESLASESQHWYDVILKYYDFVSKLDLTASSFYTLRSMYRNRHDFSTIQIQNSQLLQESERDLLQKLSLGDWKA